MSRSSRMMLAVGVALGLGARPLLDRLLTAKFSSDLAWLNDGDYRPLLSNYSDDAVLLFHDGPHRWAGPRHGRHAGKAAIEEFLREYVNARVQGTIVKLWTAGPPWALTLITRFDDHADGPKGQRLYQNQAVLVLRTRFTKIIEQQDFYIDTDRIIEFDHALNDHGVRRISSQPSTAAGG
jgi:ketosteroid isomerase-like protein